MIHTPVQGRDGVGIDRALVRILMGACVAFDRTGDGAKGHHGCDKRGGSSTTRFLLRQSRSRDKEVRRSADLEYVGGVVCLGWNERTRYSHTRSGNDMCLMIRYSRLFVNT